MKIFYYAAISLLISILVSSCVSITRTEVDTHTITNRDTTETSEFLTDPENRDNGVVFPSTRVERTERFITQKDSIVEREYPNFIRLGFFESVGTIGGDMDYSLNTGLFGVYPDIYELTDERNQNGEGLFPGGIYRIGIAEWRLRWFRDAANWTYGTNIFEAIIPDGRGENILMSWAPLYVNKRWFIRDEIPYVTWRLSFGIGYWPSQYINAAGSIDVGSIGGMNVRAYAGIALGYNGSGTIQVKNNEFADGAQSVIYPYLGIGISVLDFHNKVEETQREWKEHEHSSWDIGLFQFSALWSNTDKQAFGEEIEIENEESTSFIKGFNFRIANAKIALPVLDYKLYAGTSLLNFMFLSYTEWGVGILPIQVGYWHTLIQDELIVEPFIEYNYYPSTIFNIGGKLNLKINENLNVSLVAGYASGNPDNMLGSDFRAISLMRSISAGSMPDSASTCSTGFSTLMN
jgi:hypothetical protein